MLVEQDCVEVATLLAPLRAASVQVGKQEAKLGVETSNCEGGWS